jgi:alanyl-tRNA synthetase
MWCGHNNNSAEGRGYVLRRILRRAVRYGRDVLKAQKGFFSRLVSVVVEIMKDFYPEVLQKVDTVREIIKEEEAAFDKTLVRFLL